MPDTVIREILDHAAGAPSAGGIRGWRVRVTEQRVVGIKAPRYLVICAVPRLYAKRYGTRGVDLYAIQDATIVAAYIQLLAVDAGLATVWVGAFKENKVCEMLELPDGWRPIAVLPLGWEARRA